MPTLKPAVRYGALVTLYTKYPDRKHANVSLHGVITVMAHSKKLAKAMLQEKANEKYKNTPYLKKVKISKPETVDENGCLI